MKAETPQILWHNGKDNEQNKNAPIFSISVLESGIVAPNQFGLVLATAGNHEVNIWKLQLKPEGNEMYPKLDRNTPFKMVKVELLTTLTRHDSTVNVVKFSPNGLHLATASDSGSIIIYSIPRSKRGGGNGKHFWSSVESEQQLTLKMLSGHDGIYDLDWSADSRRLVVGTLDHCVAIYEDDNFATNLATTDVPKESHWTCTYRNTRDHSHYVQGVAMDPQGTYVASMSCDRTVRVYSRKLNKKKKTMFDKLELGKGKLIKYYMPKDESEESVDKSKRVPLFAEEAASESFFRRLAWTADGAYLVTPAALWNDQCATLMFRRHCYEVPCRILPGHDKPSRVVATNPVLFALPDGVDKHAGLEYKSVFAVLTEKSVLIYDTYHTKPIAMARGLHYSGLTDAMWTPNGQSLVVCSSDGYVSFVTFDEGELGRVYETTNGNGAVAKDMGNETPTRVTETTPFTSARLVSPIAKENKMEQKGNITTPERHVKTDVILPEQVNILQPKKKPKVQSLENLAVDQRVESPSEPKGGEEPKVNILQPKKKRKRAELTLVSAAIQ